MNRCDAESGGDSDRRAGRARAIEWERRRSEAWDDEPRVPGNGLGSRRDAREQESGAIHPTLRDVQRDRSTAGRVAEARGPTGFLGRKNGSFTSSRANGKRAALIYSWIEPCARLGNQSSDDLRNVLSRVSTHPHRRIDELSPAGHQRRGRRARQRAALGPECNRDGVRELRGDLFREALTLRCNRDMAAQFKKIREDERRSDRGPQPGECRTSYSTKCQIKAASELPGTGGIRVAGSFRARSCGFLPPVQFHMRSENGHVHFRA